MLDAFASVGATHFDVTWTSRAGDKERFRRNVSLADLTRTLPAMLERAPAHQRNVIVRPHGPGVTFIQLDDIAQPNLARLAPAVFLSLETSPGNFQAWVAMTGADDKDFSRRLRKGTGADATASGATRVAGSLNCKDKYVPEFPRVVIRQVNPGRLTTAAELEGLDLVALAEAALPQRYPPARLRSGPGPRKWPSYARCVEGAPPNRDKTGPDISRADFVFCMTAIDWGWSAEETAARLTEESSKAQRKDGIAYAARTARNALVAVAKRGPHP
jgi:RepB DNA-primase from phage plasmid